MGLFSFFKKKKKNNEADAAKVELAAPITEASALEEQVVAENQNANTEPTIEATVAEEKTAVTDAPEAEKEATVTEETAKSEPKPKKAAPKTTKKAAAPKAKTAPEVTDNADKAPVKTKKAAAPKKKEAEPTKEIKAEPVAEQAEPAEAPAKTTGRFEIKKAKDGRFVFNLYASNHVIVATSQVYSSSTSAVNGIQSVINNAHKAPIEDQSLKSYETYGFPKWEIYVDKGNQYRFRLYAANGSCICHSQGYTTKTSCKNGIDSIIRSSRNAEIDKSYLKKEEK